VLINSTKGNTAEKDAKPNLTLDAFDAIDDIKAALEKRCPGTVSCADILAIAARDAVSLVRALAEWLIHSFNSVLQAEQWLTPKSKPTNRPPRR